MANAATRKKQHPPRPSYDLHVKLAADVGEMIEEEIKAIYQNQGIRPTVTQIVEKRLRIGFNAKPDAR